MKKRHSMHTLFSWPLCEWTTFSSMCAITVLVFNCLLEPVHWQHNYQQLPHCEAQKLLLLNCSWRIIFTSLFLTVTGGAMFVFSIKLNRLSNPSVQKIMHLLILGVWKCGPTTESDVSLVWKVRSFVLQLLHPTMALCTRSSKVCGKSQITESMCTVKAADAKSTEPPNVSH